MRLIDAAKRSGAEARSEASSKDRVVALTIYIVTTLVKEILTPPIIYTSPVNWGSYRSDYFETFTSSCSSIKNVRIRFNKIVETKNGVRSGHMTLFLPGSYQINFLYFPNVQSIRWSTGVKASAGKSKKLALIIDEWVTHKGEELKLGDILDFTDELFPFYEQQAAIKYLKLRNGEDEK